MNENSHLAMVPSSSARLSGGSGVRAVDLVCTMAIHCIFL